MKVYEVVVEDRRQYVIIAAGNDPVSAQEDAIASYHRLAKGGDLIPHTICRPRVLATERYGKKQK